MLPDVGGSHDEEALCQEGSDRRNPQANRGHTERSQRGQQEDGLRVSAGLGREESCQRERSRCMTLAWTWTAIFALASLLAAFNMISAAAESKSRKRIEADGVIHLISVSTIQTEVSRIVGALAGLSAGLFSL